MTEKKDNFTQYTTVSYSGRQLLTKHKLTDEGIWHIFGEDPNCDFGGHHHQPDLGIVEGKLDYVIRYAIALPSFWTWGGGGDIRYVGKVLPKIDMDSVRRREELLAEKEQLELRLRDVKLELGLK